MNLFNIDIFRQTGVTPKQYVEAAGGNWEVKPAGKSWKLYATVYLFLIAAGVLAGCAPAVANTPELAPDPGDDSGNEFLTPQPPGKEPTPDINGVSQNELRLLPMVDSSFSTILANFESSKVYEYGPDMSVIEHENGAHFPGTLVGAFELKGTGGEILENLGIVMTSFDPDDVHLATRQGDGWVINTERLESPTSQLMSPEKDNVLHFDDIPGEFVGFGSFVGEEGTADIKLLFGVDAGRKLTGEVLYCDADKQCWPLALGEDAPEGKGSGLASMAASAMDLEVRLAIMNDTFAEWGVDSGDYQPTYHTDGDLGADLGNGVFLTVDGNALLYVGDASFDEVDPSRVEMDDEGHVKSVKGYELDEETGSWLEMDTVVLEGGLEVELGEPDENGFKEILQFFAPESMTPDDQTFYLALFDETQIGYEEGDVKWGSDADGNIVGVDREGERVVRVGPVGTKGYVGPVWDAKALGLGEKNILYGAGDPYDTAGGLPVDNDVAKAIGKDLQTQGDGMMYEIRSILGLEFKKSSGDRVFNSGRTSAVSVRRYDFVGSVDMLVAKNEKLGRAALLLVENIEDSAFESQLK